MHAIGPAGRQKAYNAPGTHPSPGGMMQDQTTYPESEPLDSVLDEARFVFSANALLLAATVSW